MIRPKTSAIAVGLAGALLVLAALVAYHGTLAGPFVLDDALSIAGNPTIRHLGRLREVLSPPPGGLTVSGRPLVNFSLAVNYAISGTAVWSYHAVNLAIHVLAGLTLLGVVRRTLDLRPAADGSPGSALWPAWAVALLWTLHPLQTESVTYVIQRAESLMGLCYLLTLYCFIRGAAADARLGPPEAGYAVANAGPEGRHSAAWLVLSVLCCLLGMASKEVMVSAPVVIFLYDRTFVSGSFREAWRRHGRLHASLAATWLLLAGLVVGTGSRGGTSGFGLGVPWWMYAQTQFRAVICYLQLSVWPHPLVFDYGTEWAKGPGDVAPYALAVAGLAAGTAWTLWRRPALGFLGAWFFLILAPTSLVPGTRQTMAEHRMYLPLAAVVALAVLGLARVAARRSLAVCLALAAALGAATARRNEDYRSKVALYRDTVARRPLNPWGHYDLGVALEEARALREAEQSYDAALRLDPRFPEAHNNLGDLMLATGRVDAARAEFAEAVRLRPAYVEARYNLGIALLRAGRPAQAAEEEEVVLLLRPNFPEGHFGLALAQAALGLSSAAAAELQAALRLRPDYPQARAALGRLRETAPPAGAL
jgi:tetratricopeptide (TPR) repeat protein